MAGLHVPGAVGIIRTRPAFGVVPGVTQRVEGLFMPWGRNIERPPGGQFDAGGQGVDVGGAIIVTVQHGTSGVLIRLQASERRGLPLLEDLSDLVGGGLVLGRPSDDAARVAPLVWAAVRDLGDQVRITAQYRHLGTALALVVALLEQIAHRAARGPLPVAQELDVHGASVPSSSGS